MGGNFIFLRCSASHMNSNTYYCCIVLYGKAIITHPEIMEICKKGFFNDKNRVTSIFKPVEGISTPKGFKVYY